MHLTRAFRRWYGQSIGEYVRARRVEAAAREICSGSASLSEIALASGFSSQAHFCTIFKRVMRCSPSEYRKMLRS